MTVPGNVTPAAEPIVTPAPQPTAAVSPAPDPTKPAETPPAEAPKLDDKDLAKDEKFAPKFAALARKEKALQSREAKIKEHEQLVQKAQSFDQKFKEDPISVLKDQFGDGWYKKLTDMVLAGNKKTPEMIAEEANRRAEALEKKLENDKVQQAKDAESIAITRVKSFTKQMVEKDPDTFELTQFVPNFEEHIYRLIEKHYEDTDRVLTPREAAELFEQQLFEEGQKWTKAKKFAPKPPEDPKKDPKPAGKTPEPTLSHDLASGAPTPTKVGVKSYDESLSESAKLLKWN